MVTIICERLYLARIAKPCSGDDRTSSPPPSLAGGGCGAIFIRRGRELLRASFSPARRAKEHLDENAFMLTKQQNPASTGGRGHGGFAMKKPADRVNSKRLGQ
jgi:hypothetical protein